MTDTPVPDVRELAARAVFERQWSFAGHADWSTVSVGGRTNYLAIADAVLAAVDPVIRGQERAAVAEEIARAIGEECRVKLIDIPGAHMSAPTSPTLTARHTRDLVAAQAAAIARSHSQYTEEETNGG